MNIKKTTKTVTDQNGNKKTYEHYCLVEKARDLACPTKFRTRLILNLGPKMPVKKEEQPELCRRVKKLLNANPNEKKLTLWAEDSQKDKYLDELAEAIAAKIRETEGAEPMSPADELVRAGDITPKSAVTAGGECIALQGIFNFGITRTLTEFNFKPKDAKMATALVMGRMLHPASEEETSRWLLGRSSTLELLGIDKGQCYPMALHRIGDRPGSLKSAFEHAWRVQSAREGQLNFVHLHDLTNTCFEGTYEDLSMLKRGHSKEKRTDCKLVSMAACVDQEGRILMTQFYPGNVSEPATLPVVLRTLAMNPWIPLVMDRGIATRDNIQLMTANNRLFIAADRGLKREWDDGAAKEYVTDFGSKFWAYRVEDKDNPGNIRVWCRSEARMKDETEMLERNAGKLKAELDEMKAGLGRPRTVKNIDSLNRRIGRLLQKHSAVSRYFDITFKPSEPDPKAASDMEYVYTPEKGSKFALPGVYCIVTNCRHLTDWEILRTYVRLTEEESVFRCLKSEAGLRPNFHKKQHRVLNHMFISVLAYQVINYIRRRLKTVDVDNSWSRVRSEAEVLKHVEMLAKCRYRNKAVQIKSFTEMTCYIRKCFDALRISKKKLLPRFGYVEKIVWENCKAANM